jgi:hypothetical protein
VLGASDEEAQEDELNHEEAAVQAPSTRKPSSVEDSDGDAPRKTRNNTKRRVPADDDSDTETPEVSQTSKVGRRRPAGSQPVTPAGTTTGSANVVAAARRGRSGAPLQPVPEEVGETLNPNPNPNPNHAGAPRLPLRRGLPPWSHHQG